MGTTLRIILLASLMGVLSVNAMDNVTNTSVETPLIQTNTSMGGIINQTDVITFSTTPFPAENIPIIYITVAVLCCVSVLILVFVYRKIQKKREIIRWTTYSSCKHDGEVEMLQKQRTARSIFDGVKMYM